MQVAPFANYPHTMCHHIIGALTFITHTRQLDQLHMAVNLSFTATLGCIKEASYALKLSWAPFNYHIKCVTGIYILSMLLS